MGPEPYPYKPTTTTTTTPEPYKKYQKREALPEPNPYKPTTTTTATPAPYKKYQKREAQPEPYNHSSTLQKIEEKCLPVYVIKANRWKLLLPTKLSQVQVLPYVLPWPQQSQ